MQVANYCRDRIHLALAEEIGSIKDDVEDNRHGLWENAFTSCFQKVDDEIGGEVSRGIIEGNADVSDVSDASLEPIAPETVGSTAVVALICSSHIIIANCGDSRAVLCRGKEPIALSVDHRVGLLFYNLISLDCQESTVLESQSLFFFVTLFSQTEKMNMQGLRHLEARSYNGMAIVFSAFLQCRGLLVGVVFIVILATNGEL